VREKHEGKRRRTAHVAEEAGGDDSVTCTTCNKELKKWYYHQVTRGYENVPSSVLCHFSR
jgi:hypothetical protein